MKICLIASSGGHFEQLLKLKPLLDKYGGFIVTEKTGYSTSSDYHIPQINRREITLFLKLVYITVLSLYILKKEKPNLIISTGVLCSIPLCLIGKMLGIKVIYIESFAKINSPTLTGRLMYKFADLFFIQWEELRKFYPNAVYKGGIY